MQKRRSLLWIWYLCLIVVLGVFDAVSLPRVAPLMAGGRVVTGYASAILLDVAALSGMVGLMLLWTHGRGARVAAVFCWVVLVGLMLFFDVFAWR